VLKKPVELVILDLNGTILDDLLPVAIPSMKNIFRTLNLQPPTEHQYRNEISSDFVGFYRKYKVPEWVTREQLNILRQLWYLQRLNELHFRPGLRGVIERLQTRGLRFALCSAEITPVMDALLTRDKLHELFGPGLVRSQAWSKTEVLSEIAAVAGVSVPRAVYVDDTEDGIKAAQSIGMQTIGFVHPTAYNEAGRIHAAKPSATVRDIFELERMLT
jgi:beta-phosphoglucomutase-like phosphatase (HAD superfamily)